MNKEINHWCKVCGTGYFACNACDRKDMIMWRAVACKPEHFQVYTVLCQYSDGSITKEQAKDYIVSLVDVEEMVNYPEPAKGQLMEILSDGKPEEEIKIENEDVAEQPDEVVGEKREKPNARKSSKFGKQRA